MFLSDCALKSASVYWGGSKDEVDRVLARQPNRTENPRTTLAMGFPLGSGAKTKQEIRRTNMNHERLIQKKEKTMYAEFKSMRSVRKQECLLGVVMFALLSLAGSASAQNTATGAGALRNNTTGNYNTADGFDSLFINSTGSYNTAEGVDSLFANQGGSFNTANGYGSLFSNVTGGSNTGEGTLSLYHNTTGGNNTAFGYNAGNTVDGSAITGFSNTFLGYGTAIKTGNISNAVAIGVLAEVDQSNSIVLGGIKGVNGATVDTNVGIGTTAPIARLQIGPSNTTSLRVEGPSTSGTGAFAGSFGGFGDFNIDAFKVLGGRFSVKENGSVTIGTASPVPGYLLTLRRGGGPAIADGWLIYSSRRWKTNIHTLHGALDKVERMRGVSYDRKDSGKHEIGVIAEEVGAVVPELVSWEGNGKDAQGVDYSRLTSLLIEATKEQQAQIQQQQKQIREQQASLTRLSSQMKVMKAALQEVGNSRSDVRSAKLDLPLLHR
jgi:hypothetical protein